MPTREQQIELIGLYIDRFNYPTQPIEQLIQNKLGLISELKLSKFKNLETAEFIISDIEKVMDDYIDKVKIGVETVDDKITKDSAFIKLWDFVNTYLQAP